MIKVSLKSIQDFDLPLDTTEKIAKRGESKRILKRLEKRYHLKTHYECRKHHGTYILYADAANNYVSKEEKEIWINSYEIYIRSSIVYKVYIAFYKFCKFMKARNF